MGRMGHGLRLTLFGLALLAGCGGEPEQGRPEPAPVPVHTVSVTEQAFPSPEEFVGNVRSREAVAVSTKMMGRVERILVEEGQRVKRGQLLVQVDDSEARSAAEQARAGIEAAQVSVRNAERNRDRYQTLYKRQAVTERELEQQEAALAAARAELAQAEAKLQAAQELFTYAKVLAPDDGVITHKWMDVGTVAAPGRPILTLENARDLEIAVPVAEDQARLISPGQKARVTIPSLGKTLRVAVTAVVAAADPVSRTSTVKLALPATAGVLPGQFAHVRFEAFSEKAVAVPAEALVVQGEMQGVFVVESGVARLRWIQTGQRLDATVQVTSGLRPGDSVVLPVPPGLVDGVPVKVVP